MLALVLLCRSLNLPPDLSLCVCIGGDEDSPILMEEKKEGVWRTKIAMSTAHATTYIYGCYSTEDEEVMGFEEVSSRTLDCGKRLMEAFTFKCKETGLPTLRVRDKWSMTTV